MTVRPVEAGYCYRCGMSEGCRREYGCSLVAKPETLGSLLEGIALQAAGKVAGDDRFWLPLNEREWNQGTERAVRDLADWLRELAVRAEEERRGTGHTPWPDETGPASEPTPIREEWSK